MKIFITSGLGLALYLIIPVLFTDEPQHEFPTMWYVRPKSLRSPCAYAQSDQSLWLSLEKFMSVKLPTEHHLEFLSLKGGCTGSSESTLVKIQHCRKSHVTAKMYWPFYEKRCIQMTYGYACTDSYAV